MYRYAVFVALPLLLAPLIAVAASAYTLTPVYNVTMSLPAKTVITCIRPLGSSKVLIAGSVGSPLRAYAAIVDLAHGTLNPLPVPGLAGALVSEIVGCFDLPSGPVLYGYVRYPNSTIRTILWLYRGESLALIPLNEVNVIPLYAVYKPPLLYILGFIGRCEARGAVSVAYVLQASIEELTRGEYSGRVYMPRIRMANSSVYQMLTGRWYKCVFFTGLHQLPTGDVQILGYAVNGTSGTGIVVRLDALFQLVEGEARQVLLPLAYSDAGEYGVEVGLFPGGRLAIGIAYPNATLHYYRVSYSGLGSIYIDDVSCQKLLCVAVGSSDVGNKTQGLILMFSVNNGLVNNVNIFKWNRVERASAVYVSPDGRIYLVGLSNGMLRILVLNLGEAQHTPVEGAKRPQLAAQLPVAIASGGLLAALAVLIIIMARRRKVRK